MKTFKHLFTALLLMCATMATAHDFEVGGIYYNITDATNKTVAVTYKGDYYFMYTNEYTGDVVIPESVTYNGTTYSVTNIEDGAFYECTGLTSIVIPNSVTSIGYSAFEDCSGLTSIEIPSSVTSIGEYVFRNCTSLTSIEIPNSVTSIEWAAFAGCTSLTSIEIPSSVTSIGNYAFSRCTGLTSIEIPNSVTFIGNYAFSGCTGLTSIVIPNSVTSIGECAFNGCSGVTSVVVDGSNTKYDSRENCNAIIETETNTLIQGCNNTVVPSSVTSIGGSAFSGCFGLTSIEIPSSVTSIGSSAFNACSGITSIEIPNSVISIGDSAFYGCTGLTSITSLIPADKLFAVGSYVFYNVDKNACTLYVPYDAKETYASTEGWHGFKNIVELHKATFCIDGEEIATSEIKAGDAVVYPDVDEREGYTLVWTPCINVMPSEDIVIEGTFIANTYTVTYIVDGEVYATDSIAYGSEIVLRDEPAKDGRKFSGWSEIPSTMPAQDVVVEGKFCYTVVFMIDGKYYSSSALYYGDEIIAPSGIPQKEGHTFVEWGELPSAMPARDMTIHAIFSVEKYQLMFIIDGEVYQTLFVGYGSEIEYPQKDGYIITWETENLPQTMPAENLIIIGTSALDTAVECVKDDNEKIVYTLDGHRILDVENLEKGVYIINGKKVLVK